MSTLHVDLPEPLRRELARRVGRQGVTEAAWVEAAVREKLAADEQLERLERLAAGGDRAEYDRVLANVPAVPPVTGDER